MLESQRSTDTESLFRLRGGYVEESSDELLGRLHRSEEERARIERQMYAFQSDWDRERDRLRSEVAGLSTLVSRLRVQAEENSDLKRRLEEARLQKREIGVRRAAEAAEVESRGTALKKRIDELEQQIVELLSRAGNDHRRKQAADERIEAEIDLHKRKLEIEFEQKLRASEVHWKKENRVLEREIERLRHEVVRRPPSLFERLRAR